MTKRKLYLVETRNGNTHKVLAHRHTWNGGRLLLLEITSNETHFSYERNKAVAVFNEPAGFIIKGEEV